MNRLTLVSAILFSPTFLASVCSAQGRNAATGPSPLETMPKELEGRFALSALPPHLRTWAAVYVLDPATGYVLDRKGTNGFTCIVERTEWARAEFRNDIYIALCHDQEGSRNRLRVYMDTAAMRAKGMSADAAKKEIARRFAAKIYVAPKSMGAFLHARAADANLSKPRRLRPYGNDDEHAPPHDLRSESHGPGYRRSTAAAPILASLNRDRKGT